MRKRTYEGFDLCSESGRLFLDMKEWQKISGLGRAAARRYAEQAGAIQRFGRSVRVYLPKIREFTENIMSHE